MGSSVFAPGHSWRRLVVPKPPTRRPKLVRVTARVTPEPELTEADADRLLECAAERRRERDAAQSCAAPAVPDERDDETAADPNVPDPNAQDGLRSPFILSDEHMRRLLDGALLMNGPTATWAHLLRRQSARRFASARYAPHRPKCSALRFCAL